MAIETKATFEAHRQEYEAKYQQAVRDLQQLEQVYQQQHEALKEAVNVLAGAVQALDRLLKWHEEAEQANAISAQMLIEEADRQRIQKYEEKHGFNEQ